MLTLAISAPGLWLAIQLFTVKCVVSVPKLAIAVRLSARSTTTITASAVLRPVVAALTLVARWLQPWQRSQQLMVATLTDSNE